MRKPNGYWSYDRCYEEALKFKSRKAFKTGSPTAYDTARQKGWLDNYTWMPKPMKRSNRYWDYETCYAAAQKCSTKKEFLTLYPGAHSKAQKKGWLKEYTWFVDGRALEAKKRKKWTKETCEAESKKYKTLQEFERKSSGAYMAALKNKWLKDYVWLERSKEKGYWQVYDNCYNEALKYKTRTEFCRKSGACYRQARIKGWLDKFTWLKDERIDLIEGKIDSVYVYEFVEEKTAYIGRTLMRTQKERDKHHLFVLDSVSSFARNNDLPLPEMKILEDGLTLEEGVKKEGWWIEKYRSDGWHVLNKAKAGAIGSLHHIKYTYEKCYEEALRYEYYNDFVKNSRAFYRVSYRNGWIVDYTWLKQVHTVNVKNWTYELCEKESKKYSSRSEFSKRCNGAYNMARINGWLEKFVWLKRQIHPAGYWTYEHCAEESKKYRTLAEWRKKNQTSYNKARDSGWIKEFTWFKKNNGQLDLFDSI
jgi:hypothetical protein